MAMLMVGPNEKQKLAELAQRADAAPVHMPDVIKLRETEKGKREHMTRMTAQTIDIPVGFTVTYSLETGHPCGTARHMSMSTAKKGRVPHPEAIWMVAQELGFKGSLDACVHWLEELKGHGQAVNLVQPLPQ